MLQDYKLGLRMLIKYPGLTVAGGLALAIAIALGAGWYDLAGKLFSPTIPLPEGDRIVAIQTWNIQSNTAELRVAHDFLEWQRSLRSITDLGAYRAAPGTLVIGNGAPQRLRVAELTPAAFRTAGFRALVGRGLLDSDALPGAPGVVVLGYGVWQRTFGGGLDVIGSEATLGGTRVTIVGIMPEGFGYPFNYNAWAPLNLRASYGPLEGGAIGVVGRLAPGVTRSQANAEIELLGEQAAAARPATHQYLRPQVTRLGELGEGDTDFPRLVLLALTNVPVLLVLMIACMSVGTLVYARTATRESEIALRSALGASRSRIITQLFVESLVLASLAAVVGLTAADRVLRWGIDSAYTDEGGRPFWMTPGLSLTTIVYAGGLAIVCAAMLSILPALRATRSRLQPQLANLGSGGATLRFGRVWTAAMIAQVALTAIGIPTALQTGSQALRNSRIIGEFPGREYVAARIEVDRGLGEDAVPAQLRIRMLAELERRMIEEPGVVAFALSDGVPGATLGRYRIAHVQPDAALTFDYGVERSDVDARFFETFDRPILAGRAFNAGDSNPESRSVVVNEAFVRGILQRGGSGSPLGARLQYDDQWFEVVGVVRDLGLDPDDEGNERPHVFHLASAIIEPLVINLRARANAAALVARLQEIASGVDPRLYVQDARPLDEWLEQWRLRSAQPVWVGAAVTTLVLFLSALGIYSLMSVTVSRRTREIGLRAALGANPHHVLMSVVRHALAVMGSGVILGGCVLVFFVVVWDEAFAAFLTWLGVTALVMFGAAVLASIVPARRALRINPIDALRES